MQDGDQEGSTTAAQLAATETLESIKAKSERAFAAVCVKVEEAVQHRPSPLQVPLPSFLASSLSYVRNT